MTKYTTEDFMTTNDPSMKAHITLHLIRRYELDVHIPSQSDDVPIASLQMSAYACQVQSNSFAQRHAVYAQDIDTGEVEEATYGPLVLIGMYEAFLFMLAGHECGEVATQTMMAYGAFMIASARPYFDSLSECEL